jgi:hypothetical protein
MEFGSIEADPVNRSMDGLKATVNSLMACKGQGGTRSVSPNSAGGQHVSGLAGLNSGGGSARIGGQDISIDLGIGPGR